jgi:hypothetical protein
MTIQNIFNLIGLITGMVGAYLMYHFTPKISSGTFLYQEAELREHKKKDAYKNKVVRFGMFLLFIGFLFQGVALLISN